jgi:hypothetical protein
MAKVKLEVANNVSHNRDGHIHRAGDTFETERDDVVEHWLALGYVSEVKKSRRKATKKK